MSEVPLRCESAITKRAAKDVHGGLQHREVCRGDRCSAISATGRGQPGPQRTTRKLCGDHTLASPTAALPDTSTRRTPQLASSQNPTMQSLSAKLTRETEKLTFPSCSQTILCNRPSIASSSMSIWCSQFCCQNFEPRAEMELATAVRKPSAAIATVTGVHRSVLEALHSRPNAAKIAI